MSDESKTARPDCVYCGGSVGNIGKGEHVIQRALGGKGEYLKCVCGDCNAAFSELDQELASRSPMAAIVQQELGAAGARTWGYDANLDLALEAHALPDFTFPPLWPQLVLLGEAPLFAFDYEDAMRIGIPDFARAFWWCLTAAWQSLYEKPNRWRIRWERIDQPPTRGRFPPRVYTEHTLDQFRQGMTFKCRYVGDIDQGWVIHHLRKWRPAHRYRLDVAWGQRDLRAHHHYRPEFVLRALVKIGLNLLVYLAGPEKVNLQSFPVAVQFARHGRRLRLNPARNGFVVNADVNSLDCPPNCHRFSLRYDNGDWTCVFAFFGGRIGATVSFPGPMVGEWRSAEVTVPFKGGDPTWQVRTSPLVIPTLDLRVEWHDMQQVMPSIPQRR